MNNHSDFCLPAMTGLNKKAAIKVGIALDAAIVFGILEYMNGNASLCLPKEELQRMYDAKITKLRAHE